MDLTPLSSWSTVKGLCTRTRRPLSMRSKSRTSLMMFSAVVAQWRSASTCLHTASSAESAAQTCFFKNSPTFRMVRRGERRSCITTRMSLDRAAMAVSAWCARRYSSSSWRLSDRHSGSPSMMSREVWKVNRSLRATWRTCTAAAARRRAKTAVVCTRTSRRALGESMRWLRSRAVTVAAGTRAERMKGSVCTGMAKGCARTRLREPSRARWSPATASAPEAAGTSPMEALWKGVTLTVLTATPVTSAHMATSAAASGTAGKCNASAIMARTTALAAVTLIMTAVHAGATAAVSPESAVHTSTRMPTSRMPAASPAARGRKDPRRARLRYCASSSARRKVPTHERLGGGTASCAIAQFITAATEPPATCTGSKSGPCGPRSSASGCGSVEGFDVSDALRLFAETSGGGSGASTSLGGDSGDIVSGPRRHARR
mmetsp:Transcript_24618/g.66945  ORF Transcript_24618/g.66945 Transcript_24618/m.66945 type:complete len:432 (-) Transcript_24618:11-1306(-)